MSDANACIEVKTDTEKALLANIIDRDATIATLREQLSAAQADIERLTRERDEWQEHHHVAVRRAEKAEAERDAARAEVAESARDHEDAIARLSKCQLDFETQRKQLVAARADKRAAMERVREAAARAIEQTLYFESIDVLADRPKQEWCASTVRALDLSALEDKP